MTTESGPKRYTMTGSIHPPDGVTDPPGTVEIPGRYEWSTGRTLDPVRGVALTAAVTLANGALPAEPDMPVVKHVTDIADLFAAWLTGEEAD